MCEIFPFFYKKKSTCKHEHVLFLLFTIHNRYSRYIEYDPQEMNGWKGPSLLKTFSYYSFLIDFNSVRFCGDTSLNKEYCKE